MQSAVDALLELAREISLAVLLVLGMPVSAPATVGEASTTPELSFDAGAAYTVAKVVDGDTISVALNGGKKITIRMIGVDTPEVVDPRKPVECFGKEASEQTKKLLTGHEVRLELDSTQGTYDKYNRVLAYVYRDDGLLVNKALIENGFGHEYTYRIPYEFQKQFKAAQKDARDHERGLWAPGVCE